MNEQPDWRAGGSTFENARENLDLVGLLALRRMARLAGAPAFQVRLYVLGIKLHTWRAAVDNTAERDAVAFAKRRHDKILSNTIARH
jgi:hypothetical protein